MQFWPIVIFIGKSVQLAIYQANFFLKKRVFHFLTTLTVSISQTKWHKKKFCSTKYLLSFAHLTYEKLARLKLVRVIGLPFKMKLTTHPCYRCGPLFISYWFTATTDDGQSTYFNMFVMEGFLGTRSCRGMLSSLFVKGYYRQYYTHRMPLPIYIDEQCKMLDNDYYY